MIWKLRKKFIRICSVSILGVFLTLLGIIYVINTVQTNAGLDHLTDIISENNGRFPEWGNPPPGKKPKQKLEINRETPFSTRFFLVRLDRDGGVVSTDLAAIASTTKAEAEEYAKKAWSSGRTRGWIDHYRYKVTTRESGVTVVFVDGSNSRNAMGSLFYTSLMVFFAGGLIVLGLIVLISRRAVRPVAESYERQKQFVTDANHELKTPLTLILTNVDIAESELGKNEWLDDIRSESRHMGTLVEQLVTLARMDEDGSRTEKRLFSLSEAAAESVAFFESVAGHRGLCLSSDIAPGVEYEGDEAAICRLLATLMDNAVKYCDAGGEIFVSLKAGRRPTVVVENSYAAVGELELHRLFDRFYRADKARTNGDGFGVGLSIAKAVAERHRGEITASNIGGNRIRFTVRL
ncbi:MAG: HAMP domain-containing histidine kinase [Agathobacter sp.]|nr:HAMP domain-containing histidine kinase [Agathobacter sp.]